MRNVILQADVSSFQSINQSINQSISKSVSQSVNHQLNSFFMHAAPKFWICKQGNRPHVLFLFVKSNCDHGMRRWGLVKRCHGVQQVFPKHAGLRIATKARKHTTRNDSKRHDIAIMAFVEKRITQWNQKLTQPQTFLHFIAGKSMIFFFVSRKRTFWIRLNR